MRNRMTRTLAAVALAVVMPIGLATASNAQPVARPISRPAETAWGCIVQPLAPQRVFFTYSFRRTVNYPTYSFCQGGTRVLIQDRQFARSRFSAFQTGRSFITRTFPTWPNVTNRTRVLPNYLVGPVGIYHMTRFQVTRFGIVYPWSSWSLSPTTWVRYGRNLGQLNHIGQFNHMGQLNQMGQLAH